MAEQPKTPQIEVDEKKLSTIERYKTGFGWFVLITIVNFLFWWIYTNTSDQNKDCRSQVKDLTLRMDKMEEQYRLELNKEREEKDEIYKAWLVSKGALEIKKHEVDSLKQETP